MLEMRATGYMHNHMRMYWGKKILEWSPSPEAAFETTLRLNNRYFLDGRDASSFTNVAWVFGLHDHPGGRASRRQRKGRPGKEVRLSGRDVSAVFDPRRRRISPR